MDGPTAVKLLFNFFDVDQDGFLDHEELLQALQAMGHSPTDRDADELLRFMAMNAEGNSIDSASDSEGDAVKSDPSKIDLAGFLSLVLEQLPPAGDGEEVLQSFRIFDRELNGYISVEDFRTVMSANEGVSQTDINDMISMGKAKNGMIDYAEVCRAVNAVSASINFLNVAFE